MAGHSLICRELNGCNIVIRNGETNQCTNILKLNGVSINVTISQGKICSIGKSVCSCRLDRRKSNIVLSGICTCTFCTSGSKGVNEVRYIVSNG